MHFFRAAAFRLILPRLAAKAFRADSAENLRGEGYFKESAHTAVMKWTTIICCAYLILFGMITTVYAFSGFSVLSFICMGNAVAVRSLLSLTGVCALWLLFWLIAFRPTKYLN